MPQLLGLLGTIGGFLGANAPAIGAIGSIAGAGTSIGEAIANSGSGGAPSPTAPTGPPAPTPPNPQQLLQQKALVSQQLPNLIGQTSGLANPDYDALMAKILSGVLGQPGANAAGTSATAQAFQPANSQPTNQIVNNQVPNLVDTSFLG